MPRRIVILGNSGSGKSFLAQRLRRELALPCLDLDTIFWEPGKPGVPRPASDAAADLDAFCAQPSWIIEGCYGELARRALVGRPELVFLNPGETVCLARCRERRWEPHKYASKEEQDERLAFLLTWVSDYYKRGDDMSFAATSAFSMATTGPNKRFANEDIVVQAVCH